MAKYTLSSYEGVHVTLPKPEVPDYLVDQKIRELMEPLAEYHEIGESRRTTMGDYVVVSTKDACIDGKSASNFTLLHALYHIGGGEMPRSFDEEILGMSAGETKDVLAKIKLPLAQDGDDLSELTMNVTVEKILYCIAPKLDDELVQEHFAPATSVGEFRAKVAAQFSLPDMQKGSPEFPDIVLGELATRLVEEPDEADRLEGMPDEALRATCAVDALADYLDLELDDEQITAQMPGDTDEQRQKIRVQMERQGLTDEAARFARREAALSWLVNNSTVSYEE